MRVGIDRPAPPAPVEHGGDGSWVELTTARNDIDAHLLTGRLHDAGIETRTIVDRTAPGAWLYGGSNPWAPIGVFVRRFDLADARIVLAEVAYEMPSGGASHPPSEPRRASALWWATAIALGIVLSALVLAQVVRLPAG